MLILLKKSILVFFFLFLLLTIRSCKIVAWNTNSIISNILFYKIGASVKADEEEFVKVLKKRAEDSDGKVKVTDVGKKESEIKVEEVMSLHDVIEGVKEKFPGLTHNRIPVCNSAAPLEGDFDTLCSALAGTNVNCPVIVNCQVC